MVLKQSLIQVLTMPRLLLPFKKAMKNEAVSTAERDDWQSYMMMGLGRMYSDHNVVMQLHYNAIRNTNEKYFQKLVQIPALMQWMHMTVSMVFRDCCPD
jgi:hypothetical protein